MSKNEQKTSRYSAGFFLRLLALLALLGFVLFEVNNATKANTIIDEVVNVYPGAKVAEAEKVLNRKPSASRTETKKIDVDDIKKQIADAKTALETETDIVEKSKLEKKITILTPQLETPEITYTVDTYRFLVNPFVGQFVEIAHKDGFVEQILANKKFTLEGLKSDLGVAKSGRDVPLVAAAGGAPPPRDNDDDDDDEEKEDSDEESEEGSEEGSESSDEN